VKRASSGYFAKEVAVLEIFTREHEFLHDVAAKLEEISRKS
jgi:hypothetical protein